jgi:hypothetical protein
LHTVFLAKQLLKNSQLEHRKNSQKAIINKIAMTAGWHQQNV